MNSIFFPEQYLSQSEIEKFQQERINHVDDRKTQKFITFKELDFSGKVGNYWFSEYLLTNHYDHIHDDKYWKLRRTVNVSSKDLINIKRGLIEIAKNKITGNNIKKADFFFYSLIAAQKYFSQDNERLFYWSENTDEIIEFNEKLLEQIELNEAFHENMKARMINPNKRWKI